jgi:hypothetical protein
MRMDAVNATEHANVGDKRVVASHGTTFYRLPSDRESVALRTIGSYLAEGPLLQCVYRRIKLREADVVW